MKQFLLCLLASAALAICGGLASAATINHAISGTATVSNTYLNFDANRAIDGSVGTFWNAGQAPNTENGTVEWIEIDLGATRRIDTLRALTVQDPSTGFTSHELSLDGAAPIAVLAGNTSNNQWLTFGFDTPVYARTLRITTVISPSWVSWAEIEVLSTPPVPLPAGLPLLVMGLGGFALCRRARAV